MAGFKIAVADTIFPNLDLAQEALDTVGGTLHIAKEKTPEAILDVASDADGVLVTFAQLTGDLIKQFEKCRVIGRFGIGVDNIDIPVASEKGIVVTYVPDYCLDEVSDHAMALLLSLARKIPFADRLVQAGRWEMPAVVPIGRLRGRTLGLLGLGKIPSTVAPKAQAFGMTVLAHDPYVPADHAKKLGVELVDFDTLLARSDYVSIHAPLTPDTHHLFNADAFKKMKPEALLVNTARGPLVNEEDLAAALDAGEIGGAALDVMNAEPPPDNSPLKGRDNVILTPHTSFYSEEALGDLQRKCAQDVASVLKGDRPVYPVNPDVLK